MRYEFRKGKLDNVRVSSQREMRLLIGKAVSTVVTRRLHSAGFYFGSASFRVIIQRSEHARNRYRRSRKKCARLFPARARARDTPRREATRNRRHEGAECVSYATSRKLSPISFASHKSPSCRLLSCVALSEKKKKRSLHFAARRSILRFAFRTSFARSRLHRAAGPLAVATVIVPETDTRV